MNNEEQKPQFIGAKKQDGSGKKSLPVVKMSIKATIKWEDTYETVQVYRSVPSLLDYLIEVAKNGKHEIDRRLSITLPPETVDGESVSINKTIGGKSLIVVIADGTLEEVLETLNARYMPINEAMQQIAALITRLFDISQLKGIILTGVAGESQPLGYGLINDATELEESDLIALGVSADNQVQLYKDSMKKNLDIDFPADNPVDLVRI